jgi:hypothetical protein
MTDLRIFSLIQVEVSKQGVVEAKTALVQQLLVLYNTKRIFYFVLPSNSFS